MNANAKIALSKKMLAAALDFADSTEIVGLYVSNDPEYLYIKLYDPRFDLVARRRLDLDIDELPILHRYEVLS
jgi:hypothetical protein